MHDIIYIYDSHVWLLQEIPSKKREPDSNAFVSTLRDSRASIQFRLP